MSDDVDVYLCQMSW